MPQPHDDVVLVTGGAGFIGSRLVERMARLGLRVISLDDYSTGSRLNHVNDVQYRQGSTRDIAQLVPEVPALIFHLGEYARVEKSFADAAQVEASNVVGSAAVFAFWQKTGAKLIYAGSSTRFASEWSPSPYAISKRDNADRVLLICADAKLSGAVAYFYNVYGPGERAGNSGTLIEIFRRCHENGLDLPIVSPGTQRRNFTHVDDIVDGLLLVAGHGEGEFSIGAAESYSVIEVAEMFGGRKVMWPPHSGNRGDAHLDTTRIAALGWKQRRNLVDYVSCLVGKKSAHVAAA